MWVSSRTRGFKRRGPQSCRSASHRSVVSKWTMSPRISTLTCQNTGGRFPRRLLRGGNRRHRPPTLSDRNRAAVFLDLVEQRRHFALNSVAPITRDCIPSGYIQYGHLTSSPGPLSLRPRVDQGEVRSPESHIHSGSPARLHAIKVMAAIWPSNTEIGWPVARRRPATNCGVRPPRPASRTAGRARQAPDRE